MKKRLIILSDISGSLNSEWTKALIDEFNIEHLDSRELAGIDIKNDSREIVHTQFINGGIDLAADALIRQNEKPVHVLAFSIGGTIAWKAALIGLQIKSLFAISSTRLRYEKKKPDCPTLLYFGAKDPYKPKDYWFDNLNIQPNIISSADHELYNNSDFIKKISVDLKAFVQTH